MVSIKEAEEKGKVPGAKVVNRDTERFSSANDGMTPGSNFWTSTGSGKVEELENSTILLFLRSNSKILWIIFVLSILKKERNLLDRLNDGS